MIDWKKLFKATGIVLGLFLGIFLVIFFVYVFGKVRPWVEYVFFGLVGIALLAYAISEIYESLD